MIQTIKTAETEYREVIMSAMRVLMSDQTFDEPTTLAAMNIYQGTALLQQIQDIRSIIVRMNNMIFFATVSDTLSP